MDLVKLCRRISIVKLSSEEKWQVNQGLKPYSCSNLISDIYSFVTLDNIILNFPIYSGDNSIPFYLGLLERLNEIRST